jgi:carbonic anhydrase/acetyltransferase-like protein (isoleucine patch superfamily)
VIGETAEIGDNVTIYQCVTLGGTNPANGVPGKRHPTLQDNAIIGSGAQILGPITVGQRARVGANAVVTEDVPEGATMVGLKARSTLVPVETWLKDFIPMARPARSRASRRVAPASMNWRRKSPRSRRRWPRSWRLSSKPPMVTEPRRRPRGGGRGPERAGRSGRVGRGSRRHGHSLSPCARRAAGGVRA